MASVGWTARMPVCLARLPPAAEKTEESSLALLDGIVQEMWSDISAPIFFPWSVHLTRSRSRRREGGREGWIPR